MDQFRYENSDLPLKLRGIKQKKSSWASEINNTSLLFYSPKPLVYYTAVCDDTKNGCVADYQASGPSMNFNISKLLVYISRFPLTVARKNLGNFIADLT